MELLSHIHTGIQVMENIGLCREKQRHHLLKQMLFWRWKGDSWALLFGSFKNDISPNKHTVVFCIHLCFYLGSWGLGLSLWENWEANQCRGISAFSLCSNFSWLNHPFYVLTGAVLDVQWTSCSPKPLNIQTVPHLGKTWPVFGAHFLAAVVWIQVSVGWKTFLIFRETHIVNTWRQAQHLRMYIYIMHKPSLTRLASMEVKLTAE